MLKATGNLRNILVHNVISASTWNGHPTCVIFACSAVLLSLSFSCALDASVQWHNTASTNAILQQRQRFSFLLHANSLEPQYVHCALTTCSKDGLYGFPQIEQVNVTYGFSQIEEIWIMFFRLMRRLDIVLFKTTWITLTINNKDKR